MTEPSEPTTCAECTREVWRDGLCPGHWFLKFYRETFGKNQDVIR